MNFYLIYVGLILAHLYGGMPPAPLWVLGPLIAVGAASATAKTLIDHHSGSDRFDVFGDDA